MAWSFHPNNMYDGWGGCVVGRMDPSQPQLLLVTHFEKSTSGQTLYEVACIITDIYGLIPPREWTTTIHHDPRTLEEEKKLAIEQREEEKEEEGHGQERLELLERCAASPHSLAAVQDRLYAFLIKALCEIAIGARAPNGYGAFLLCGFNASTDRAHLGRWFPRIAPLLHFRSYSVSNVLSFFRWFRPDLLRAKPRRLAPVVSISSQRSIANARDTHALLDYFRRLFLTNNAAAIAATHYHHYPWFSPPLPPPVHSDHIPRSHEVPDGKEEKKTESKREEEKPKHAELGEQDSCVTKTDEKLEKPIGLQTGSVWERRWLSSTSVPSSSIGSKADTAYVTRECKSIDNSSSFSSSSSSSSFSSSSSSFSTSSEALLLTGCDLETPDKENPEMILEIAFEVAEVQRLYTPPFGHVVKWCDTKTLTRVVHWDESLLRSKLSAWSRRTHTAALLEDVRRAKETLEEVEQKCILFLESIRQGLPSRRARFLLVGSNTGFDRDCLQRLMPRLYSLLDPHRIFDVTSLLLSFTWWRADLSDSKPPRSRFRHRAEHDIRDSMALFRFYQWALLHCFPISLAPTVMRTRRP